MPRRRWRHCRAHCELRAHLQLPGTWAWRTQWWPAWSRQCASPWRGRCRHAGMQGQCQACSSTRWIAQHTCLIRSTRACSAAICDGGGAAWASARRGHNTELTLSPMRRKTSFVTASRCFRACSSSTAEAASARFSLSTVQWVSRMCACEAAAAVAAEAASRLTRERINLRDLHRGVPFTRARWLEHALPQLGVPGRDI